MLDDAELNCNEIFRKGGAYDNFIISFFDAMETSDEAKFLALVVKKRDEWEEGILGASLFKLNIAATLKYKNIERKKQSGTNAESNDKNSKKVKRSLCRCLPLFFQLRM